MKRAIAALAVPLALACTGSITGEAPGHEGAPAGNGVGSGTGAGAGAGSPGGSGAPGVGPQDNVPGRTPMRRLTVTEYTYTVRDLLGEDVSALLADFPADARSAEGFDNDGDSLGVQTSQLEVFERAAAELATRAATMGSPARQHLAVCSEWGDAACRRKVLQTFADKAWRRPTTSAEVDQLVALGAAAASAGASTDEQVGLGVRGILVAPQFLFRVERLPPTGTAGTYRVTAHELATRLSYFLWSSTPDDALTQSAAAGTLATAADVSREVSRMLADGKATGLADNFAAQWLALRNLNDHSVDATFTAFTPALSASMSKETTSLFNYVVAKGLPVTELLTANYSFVDDPLAKFYGVSVASGRADLSTTVRRGVLGQAALLTLTAYPDRTSIVRRGMWVLNNLLCAEPPPPPPPGVDTTLPDPSKGTLRERMAVHRANPTCAACHDLMDPIGLGLENFDAIGRYRETENGASIDASGTYTDGRAFKKPSELSTLIAEDPRFVACVSEKLLAFGLGRSLTSGDHAAATAVAQASGALPTLRDLIANAAQNQVFAEQMVEP